MVPLFFDKNCNIPQYIHNFISIYGDLHNTSSGSSAAAAAAAAAAAEVPAGGGGAMLAGAAQS